MKKGIQQASTSTHLLCVTLLLVPKNCWSKKEKKLSDQSATRCSYASTQKCMPIDLFIYSWLTRQRHTPAYFFFPFHSSLCFFVVVVVVVFFFYCRCFRRCWGRERQYLVLYCFVHGEEKRKKNDGFLFFFWFACMFSFFFND